MTINYLLQILVSDLNLDKRVVVIVVFRERMDPEGMALTRRTRILTRGLSHTKKVMEMVF